MSTMAAPTSTFSMSMDEDLKKNFEAVCLEMGLSASAAVTVFATQVVPDSSRRLKSRGSKLLPRFCDHLIPVLSNKESANRH